MTGCWAVGFVAVNSIESINNDNYNNTHGFAVISTMSNSSTKN